MCAKLNFDALICLPPLENGGVQVLIEANPYFFNLVVSRQRMKSLHRFSINCLTVRNSGAL
jgi:hypothetical protein